MTQLNTEQIILAFINADTLSASQNMIEKYPELLTDQADTLLNQQIAAAYAKNDPENALLLTDYLTLLQRCREVGLEIAFAEITDGVSPILDDIFAFINADSWDKAKHIVEQHPELLSDEADAEISALIDTARTQDRKEDEETFIEYRSLLQRCHQIGISNAFDEKIRSGEIITPVQFEQDLSQVDEARKRYLQYNDTHALDEWVEIWEKILAQPTFPSTALRFRILALNNAGEALIRRYWTQGKLEDFDQALTLWQRTVEIASNDDPKLPAYLNNLSVGLKEQYHRTGFLPDLETSIEFQRKAVTLTPADSSDMPLHLGNLGSGVYQRFRQIGELSDLEDAIDIYREAIKLTHSGFLELVFLLNNLAIALRERYDQIGSLPDIEEAINLSKQVLELVPNTFPEVPRYLSNLASSLWTRYIKMGELSDLEESIKVNKLAIDAIPTNFSNLATLLNNLAAGLKHRHERTNNMADLVEAQETYRQACIIGLDKALEITLGTSQNWGNWALERQAWSEAIEAYDYGVRAIDELYQSQIQRGHKEIWLRDATGLHFRAAYAYAQNRQPQQAAILLERGRAFLLSESLERELNALVRLTEIGYVDLYQRYVRHLDQLQVLENQSYLDMKRLRGVRSELEEIVTKIQQIPGYEDFFRPPTFEDVMQVIISDSQSQSGAEYAERCY